MTTEVAIINKEAIALAADSAVTVGISDGTKIYNSANKLFAYQGFVL
jgi:ATP-dependent protease HslVU (ClpYQ) peptidase subunit